MNNLDYVFQVICVGLVVATFLLNTGRGVKAIEVCKECLICLNNEVLDKKKEQFVDLVSIAVYRTMFMAYCFIPDYTNAIKHGRQLLDIYYERGKTREEGILLLKLAAIYEKQYKYAEAGNLYEKAINITREIGNTPGEAALCETLGTMFKSLGEYDKAKLHLEKALAIRIETGDRAGEASCYENLGNVFQFIGKYDKAKEYRRKELAIRIGIGDRKGCRIV